MEIKDTKGKTVRRFDGAGPLLSQLSWEGKSGDKAMVPDGIYQGIFWARDSAKNAASAPPQRVTVGARIPDLFVKAGLNNFSPNADGAKDQVLFELKAGSFNKIKSWSLEITDMDGIVYRRFDGLGPALEEALWLGERDDKSPAGDGLYRYIFRAADEAGNKNETAAQSLRLDTTRPETGVQAYPALFSPNGDGESDKSSFQLSYQDASPAGAWSLTIKNEGNKTVRVFSGHGALPHAVEWDGKGEGGKTLKDGPYTFVLATEDEVANKSVTLDQILRLDTLPPLLTVKAEHAVFSPESESGNDKALFQLTAQDASNITEWALEFRNSKGVEAHRIKGVGIPPAEIIWEGTDHKGRPFPDDQYSVTLAAKDEIGNAGLSAPVRIQIDTSKPLLQVAAQEESVPSLVPESVPQESGRGIVINLAAEVLFETGKALIRPQAYPTLDEAAAVIRKYPNRQVIVEGHTDNVPIRTPDFADNQQLSEGRAKAVIAYLSGVRKLDRARFSHSGYAEHKPIASNETEDGRRKNRRVEIVIQKPPQKAANQISEMKKEVISQ